MLILEFWSLNDCIALFSERALFNFQIASFVRFRILAVFDKHFQRQWRARDIKIIVEEQQTSIQEDKERWPLYGNGARNNGANYDGPTNDEKDVFLQQAKFRANNSNDSAGGEQGKDGEDDDTKVVERHKCLWVLWNDCSIADFVSRTASKNSILGESIIRSQILS